MQQGKCGMRCSKLFDVYCMCSQFCLHCSFEGKQLLNSYLWEGIWRTLRSNKQLRCVYIHIYGPSSVPLPWPPWLSCTGLPPQGLPSMHLQVSHCRDHRGCRVQDCHLKDCHLCTFKCPTAVTTVAVVYRTATSGTAISANSNALRMTCWRNKKNWVNKQQQ